MNSRPQRGRPEHPIMQQLAGLGGRRQEQDDSLVPPLLFPRLDPSFVAMHGDFQSLIYEHVDGKNQNLQPLRGQCVHARGHPSPSPRPGSGY